MRPNGLRKNVPKCQAPHGGEGGGEGQGRSVPPPLKMLSASLERSVYEGQVTCIRNEEVGR